MASSFITYIDESGCDGFKFGKGSSDWMVLAAVVMRRQREPDDVKVIDQVRSELNRPHPKELHFRDLTHEQRVVYTDRIGKAKLRCCAVLVHKPSLLEPGTFQVKNRLYHYACRYLLERVSWICKAYRRPDDDDDGVTDIVFSHRRTTPHTEICAYLERLKSKDTDIEWPAIDTSRVWALPHRQRKGLLLADAVASSFWCGLELSRYGFAEGRYAAQLKPVMFAGRGGAYSGAGVKIWPREAVATLDLENQHSWLASVYGVKKRK